jgi:hypothetical protein
VGVTRDGRVRSVVVDHTIDLAGIGDFSLEITGPATKVARLPRSDADPGLRNGSIIWEGFCPGRRTLRARMTVDTGAVRLTPLPVTVSRTPSGIRLTNATARLEPFDVGEVDPAALAAARAAATTSLERGEPPAPGTAQLPAALPTTGPRTTQTASVVVPLRITGTFAGSRVDRVLTEEPLDIQVPPTSPIAFTAEPALPNPTALRDAADGPATLHELQRVLWETALGTGSGYLGLPVDGLVHARYRYSPAAPPRVVPAAAPQDPGPRPLAISAVVVAAIAAGVLARRWWRTH